MDESAQKRMRVLYVSSMMRPAAYAAQFLHAAARPSQATQKYNAMLTAGLAACGAEVIAVCAPPTTRHTCGKRFLHRRTETDGAGVRYCYLPVLDLPAVKNLATWLTAFFTVLRLCNRQTRVLCYGLCVSAAGGARAAAKLRNVPVGAIVSDVPEQLSGGMRMQMAQRALTRYDGYVLFTEAMNGIVNPHGRPYCVLEGMADEAMAQRENTLAQKRPERVCLYAGMLHEKYGALRLTEAFMQLKDPDCRLTLFGTGDAAERIQALAEKDNRIEYRGVTDNETVLRAETAATLLVNPRPSDEEFTKYSFPSKNLEYMASGTPVLTTRLPGMPTEYEDYVYLIDDETPQGIAQTLMRTLALPRETLHEKGSCAKRFVLTEKSNVRQAGRMLEFMEGLHGCRKR